MTKKLHRESLIVAVILLILLGACIYLDSIRTSVVDDANRMIIEGL